jgi:hypothetical protein
MKKLLLTVFAATTLMAAKAQDCSDLIISKYIQFGGNNKGIEIYNTTTTAINLNGYILERWKSNSAGLIATSMSDSLHLRGTVAPLSTFVIINGQTTAVNTGSSTSPKCDPALQAYAQQLDNLYGTYGATTGAPTYFKGNDCLILRKPNGNPADIFGEIGVTVTYWSTIFPYRGQTGQGKWITKGYMMVRKPGVKKGVTVFPTEFNPLGEYDTIAHVYPNMTRQDTLDTYSLFGTHTCDCANQSVNNLAKTNFVTLFPNPSAEGTIYIKSSEIINEVKVFDITGKLLFLENKLNRLDYVFESSKLKPGSYQFSIKLANGTVENKSILLQ